MKVGLISDTHGWIHPSLPGYFSECEEIWHAGDIGSVEVADRLASFCRLRAVHGNIDDAKLRRMFPGKLRFEIDGFRVFITHIGGYPGRYAPGIVAELREYRPGLFICGHSHITKVQRDIPLGLVHINPGAAGYHGFHHMMTAVRFSIGSEGISDLELIELGERGHAPVNG